MKKEYGCLIYSMINNLIIGSIKIIGGIIFNLSSLFADGMHTFSDFITDIISFIGSKISKKRPTKIHPFGFGKIEYLTNLFIGIIIFLLGIFIIYNAFGKKNEIPTLMVLSLLLVVFILKLVCIIILNRVGKKINSEILITSVKESQMDLYSTILVAIITIMLQFSNKYSFLKYVDLLGSIFIGILVLKMSLSILISNSLSLIGELETNKEVLFQIENFLKQYKLIKKEKIELIKYGPYYKLRLDLELDSNLNLRKITALETKIKKDIIRHRSLKIKYIDIYITESLGD